MSEIKVDTVAEKTSANGVTVDGLNIKDSKLVTANSIVETNLTDNIVTLAKMASGTDGNIISYDASGNPVAIATGNDGQVLTSTGAGSPPAFETLPSSGKILQVVSDTGATYNQSNTTTTYADVQKSGSTWEVAITPSATSSKIFGVVTIQFSFAGSDAQARTALNVTGKIGSGSYSQLSGNGFTGLYDASDQPDFHSSDTFNFLWSPSTTSECKVKLQFKNAYTSSNMTSSINSTGTNQTVITLMEVAG